MTDITDLEGLDLTELHERICELSDDLAVAISEAADVLDTHGGVYASLVRDARLLAQNITGGEPLEQLEAALRELHGV